MADQPVEVSLPELLRVFAQTLQALRADLGRASGSALRLNEERQQLEQRLQALSARVDQLAMVRTGAAATFPGRRSADGTLVVALAGAEYRIGTDGVLQP